jgi:hypothetical protein
VIAGTAAGQEVAELGVESWPPVSRHYFARDRAEAIAMALVSRGYRRRERGLEPGDVRVRSGADSEGYLVEWAPLTWDLEMLRRLQQCAGNPPTETTQSSAAQALRALSQAFPDRCTALAALDALEALLGGVP